MAINRLADSVLVVVVQFEQGALCD